MALKSKGCLAIQEGVDNLTPFKVGNVSGNTYTGTLGRLPEPFRSAYDGNHVAYVILSYATPIAWRLVGGQWVVPPVKYSVTTTNHQNTVLTAFATPRFYNTLYPQRRADSGFGPRRVPPLPTMTPERESAASIIADIDATLASVAADGWTNPYGNPNSPARRLATG